MDAFSPKEKQKVSVTLFYQIYLSNVAEYC